VTGTETPAEAARRLVERGPRLAIVTRGADGCVYARRGGAGVIQGAVPSPRVEVADTTGAGDAFQAVLVAGLARDGASLLDGPAGRLEALLRVAAAAGARVCERLGAVAGLPRAVEVEFDRWVASH
jgi:sugar/nucleoside kinase (ribokinase family)